MVVGVVQPLVHLKHRAEQRFGAVLQLEQLGVAHAQQVPIQPDLAWPLALFSYKGLVDCAVGMLVGGMLVGTFLGHDVTLPPVREYLAS
jgi:hypothetical protein